MTSPTPTEISVDSETMEAMASGLDHAAADLETLLKKASAHIRESLDALTVRGKTPPVYKDTSAALEALDAKFHAVHKTLTDKLTADAKVLRGQVQRVADDEHRAAKDADNITVL